MHHQDYEKYLTYRTDDFLLDLDFQQWAQGQENPFWDKFSEDHPQKRDDIEEARQLIRRLNPQEKPLPSAYTKAQLAGVYATIEKRKQPQKRRSLFQTNYFRFAASVVILLAAAVAFYFYQSNSHQVFQTAYQETQTLQLEDGTKVTLNASSRLRVAPDLQNQPVREVWLEGEAFFNVSKSSNPDGFRQFIVHTSMLDVEVLGTVFNVKSRSDNTQVLLEEGSVKVAQPITQEQLLMIPGEVVEIHSTDQKIRKRVIEETKPLAWRENTFDFNNASLEIVARQIQDYYGKEVRFSNPAIADYQFTARVSRDDLDLLLSLITGAFSVRITEQDDTLTISEQELN